MQAELEKCAFFFLVDFTHVQSEAENRIIVVDSTVVSAFCVWQEAIIDKVGSHFDVLCRLVSQLLHVIRGVIPAGALAIISPYDDLRVSNQ